MEPYQFITEWLIDVDERASLARVAPNDRLAYEKLSLSHLSGHFMALPAEVNTNWTILNFGLQKHSRYPMHSIFL